MSYTLLFSSLHGTKRIIFITNINTDNMASKPSADFSSLMLMLQSYLSATGCHLLYPTLHQPKILYIQPQLFSPQALHSKARDHLYHIQVQILSALSHPCLHFNHCHPQSQMHHQHCHLLLINTRQAQGDVHLNLGYGDVPSLGDSIIMSYILILHTYDSNNYIKTLHLPPFTTA